MPGQLCPAFAVPFSATYMQCDFATFCGLNYCFLLPGVVICMIDCWGPEHIMESQHSTVS